MDVRVYDVLAVGAVVWFAALVRRFGRWPWKG